MPKPKAPRWLTESFRDGIDERGRIWESTYFGANPGCELAQHDPLHCPCCGRLERIHFVNRQRIENAMGALLPTNAEDAMAWDRSFYEDDFTFKWVPSDLVLLAAWDPRVGGISCQQHHRRYDNHATPPLIVPYGALPSHVIDWAEDWGLESQLLATRLLYAGKFLQEAKEADAPEGQ